MQKVDFKKLFSVLLFYRFSLAFTDRHSPKKTIRLQH